MPRRGGRSPAARLLLGLALPSCVVAATQSCDALADMKARLNPGFWVPSFVFRSLWVRPGAIHPPNLTKATQDAELVGACDPAPLRADSFEWQKPTSDGGDWIASTSAKPLQINIDGFQCDLTGLAVTTAGWPSLRLQFEECPRKTAVEVPLVNATGGMKLVHWMCQVTVASSLCSHAASKLTTAANQTVWPTQVHLDLSHVALAASQGATRMQIYENCYENLDWFVINTPLAVDGDEWEMLLSLRSMLAPSLQSSVRIKANIVVETVCMPDCTGQKAEKCHERAPVKHESLKPDLPTDLTDDTGLEGFVADAMDQEVAPWLAGLLFAFFLLGCLIVCCLSACLRACCTPKPPKVKQRRIKQVAVVYQDGSTSNQNFYT